MYLINVIIFNEIHLRRKNERLGWVLLYVYYLPYKIVLTLINVASCYWYVLFALEFPNQQANEGKVSLEVRALFRKASP